MQLDPSYYAIDREEAARTAQAMHTGMQGSVNFTFENLRTNKVSLEPTQILFMVPGKDTQVADQIGQMFGSAGASNPMAGMMSQMAQNMPVPIVMSFGDAATSGAGETGVSGNQMSQKLITNSIRELERGVLEQQLVTQKTTWLKGTGRARTSYGETVIRFTDQGSNRMYVQAATIEYGADKRFLDKFVFYGYITRGQVMQTNPMAQMGGMGGLGGLGGMGGLEQMFGGGAPQGGGQSAQQMQQLQKQMQGMQGLPGLDPNMFERNIWSMTH